MNPTITIVTVCRNAEATLERAVLSVLGQTYPKVEYVVIDGASTDGTLDILGRYRDRITLVSEPDEGIYDAMNKALGIAQGDWLLFLGADDYLLDDSVLEKVAERLKDPDAVYYGEMETDTQDGAGRTGRVTRYTVLFKVISHQATFYPRSAYTRLRYDTRYKVAADRVYNINLFSQGVRFRYLDLTVSFFSQGGISSLVVDEAYRKDRLQLARKLGLLPYLSIPLWNLYFKFHHFLHRCKVRIFR